MTNELIDWERALATLADEDLYDLVAFCQRLGWPIPLDVGVYLMSRGYYLA